MSDSEQLHPDHAERRASSGETPMADRLERAADRVGEHFEALLAMEPADQPEAIALIAEIDRWLEPVDSLARHNPELAAKSDLDILIATANNRSAASAQKAKRRTRGTAVPTSDRRRRNRRARAIGRDTALSGPDRQTRPSAAVVRHWLARENNDDRIRSFRDVLEQRLDDLPPTHEPERF